MKISLTKLSFCLTVAILSLSTAVGAAWAEDSATTSSSDTHVQVDVSATATLPVKPAEVPLRDQVKARAEQIKANVAANRDERNKIIDERRETIKGIKVDARSDIKDEKGSSTARMETLNKMRRDIFTTRRDALVRQLTVSINNLENIKTRIDTRIAKIKTDGKDTTEAEKLLVVAVAKIATAKTNVTALTNIEIQTTSTSTPDAELARPRLAAETAIRSIEEARRALQKVVVAIAHSMGREINNTATTTVSATTTVTTATTTASSTNQ